MHYVTGYRICLLKFKESTNLLKMILLVHLPSLLDIISIKNTTALLKKYLNI